MHQSAAASLLPAQLVQTFEPLLTYSPDGSLADSLQLLFPRERLALFRRWHVLAGHCGAHRPLLLAVPALDIDVVSRLRALRSRFPLAPLFLLTSSDKENARALGGVMVDAVGWLEEVGPGLVPQIEAFTSLRRMRVLAQLIERHSVLPLALRHALTASCLMEHPPRSVSELAQLAGLTRGALWKQWRGLSSKQESGVRLEDMVDWLLVLRAVTRRRRDDSWSEVSRQLSMRPASLGRLVRRVTGLGLRYIDRAGDAAIWKQFELQVLPVLTDHHRLNVSA